MTRAVLAVVALAAVPHTFGVKEVQQAFKRETGLPLARFAAASTRDVTSLRTRPHETRRFGEFQLFVLRGSRVARLQRVFTHGKAPDRRGIYWVPDQAGGWIAVTLFERNLVVAWFPSSRGRRVDVRWTRLESAVASFARRSPP